MAEIREYTPLKCYCGGELFERTMRLKFKSGGGTVEEPVGYRCVLCNALADQAYMIKLVEIAKLNKQLAETKAELEAKSA